MGLQAPVLPGLFFGCNSILIRITCPCGHIVLINTETLPRDLVCSHRGAGRRIERKDGARIVNRVAFEEWLFGASGARGSQKENCRRHSKDFCQTLQRQGGGVALA